MRAYLELGISQELRRNFTKISLILHGKKQQQEKFPAFQTGCSAGSSFLAVTRSALGLSAPPTLHVRVELTKTIIDKARLAFSYKIQICYCICSFRIKETWHCTECIYSLLISIEFIFSWLINYYNSSKPPFYVISLFKGKTTKALVGSPWLKFSPALKISP